MEHDIRVFLETLVAQLHPLQRDLHLAKWNLATTGDRRFAAESEHLKTAIMTLFSRPDDWARVREWYGRRADIRDDRLRRQIEMAYFQYARNQADPRQIARIARSEAQLDALYSTFRATLDGQPVSDNDIKQILATEGDSARQQAAWEASKQIGALAAPDVLELVALRNTSAQALGWSDYYRMALDVQEIDEHELFALLDSLEQQTREPFRQVKEQIDTALAGRFGVAPADLRPWHYSDPFFQKPPITGSAELDAVYAAQSFEALTLRTFDGMGLDVRDILSGSDLYERPGKHQHAFCMHIDPLSDDVRVLANLRHTAESMDTCLHEFGHAIYNRYLARDLPFLLRKAAHISTTEAIAMLMGRLARNAEWLEKIRGLPADAARSLAALTREQERIKQLVFVRWALVMVHFERDLYRSGDDLTRRWWEYVEQFQHVPRPEGRDAPDWAAKVHLATVPVYYHNYVLGELTASQLCCTISAQAGDGRRDGVAVLVDNPAAGAWLREHLFVLGATLPWNQTLVQVTGERLTPQYFVADFVRPHA